MNRILIIWGLSIVSTLAVAIYQRITGPSYPLKFTVDQTNFKLPRSSSLKTTCTVTIPESPNFNNAIILWRYYPGEYSYDTIPMRFHKESWIAQLPTQPPAGKLQYYVELYQNENLYFSTSDKQAIIRFRGDVPSQVLLPHILFMFLSILLCMVAMFTILFKKENFNIVYYLAVLSLFLGGLVFGPIVQKYAFGAYWTGFPFGQDLTDNKTLIVFIISVIPLFIKKIETRKKWIIIATISMLIINSIPHSTRGSELNRETNAIETGRG